MFVDIGLNFYAVPSQPTLVTLRSRSWVIDFDKFSGKAQVRRATLSCDSSYYKINHDNWMTLTYFTARST